MSVITEDRLPVADGDVVAEKYRVGRILGLGGMAVVVAATHEALNQQVALKVMLPTMLARPGAVERFLGEGRAVAQLKNNHVCKVLDVGTLPSGEPYLVMEYLEGHDLEVVLERRGALPVDDAIEIIVQACSAIAEAHEAGIVHRDLKPSNLFIMPRRDGRPHVKVLDFGISKVTDSERADAPRTTKETTIMGSPAYMSPEQTRSARDVDLRTDIWALGVILYRLLSGREPFVGPTVPDIFAAVLQKPPVPLDDLQGYLPEGLEAVVMQCLEKDPASRYSNVVDLAAALAKLSTRGASFSFFPASSERMIPIDGAATSAKAGHKTATAWDEIEPPKPKSRAKLALVLSAAALVAVLGVVAFVKRGVWLPHPAAHAPPPAAPIETQAIELNPAPPPATATATATATVTPIASAAPMAAAPPTPVAIATAATATTPKRSTPRKASPPPPSPPPPPPPPAPAPSPSPTVAPTPTAAPSPTSPTEPPRHRTSW